MGRCVSLLPKKTGKIAWRERIGGEYSASPIFADGRIHCFSQERNATVLAPSRRFEEQATNQLALSVLAENELDEGFMASLAVVGNALILRTKTLQAMVLQGDPYSEKIYLLPAWPPNWNVSVKLYAPRKTVIECEYREGEIVQLKVTPAERRKDVVIAQQSE